MKEKIRKAIYPGTFNPIHEGHIEIIKRASELFDHLYVVMAINEQKTNYINDDAFSMFLNKIDKMNLKNVDVLKTDKTISSLANELNCDFIVRAIRNSDDAKYEIDLFDIYTSNNNLEEILFISKNNERQLSSSFIKNRKMFLFDVDGTLCNSKKEITPLTEKAIKSLQRQGHIVSIITGRCPFQISHFVKQLDINDYVVGCGGASIYNIKENKYYVTKKTIPIEARQILLDLAIKYKRELAWSEGKKVNRIYFGTDPEIDINDELFFIGGSKRKNTYDNWEELKETFFTCNMIQISFKAESDIIRQEYLKLKDNLPNGVNCHETSRVYIEFSPIGIDKLTGVKFLQSKFNIKDENIYCFGDSGNDVPMIKNVFHGVAMGNASKELLEVANEWTDTNDNEGIYKYLLGKRLINE